MDKIKILIVEDEILVARDLQARLTLMGYSAQSVATTGMQAIQNVKEDLPNIILMDIVLQGNMDGIETAEILRSEFEIPIIYITAHGDEKIFERAKKTFPYGYVIKPFTNDDIRKTIEIAVYKLSFEKERKELIQKLKNEINERKLIEKSLRKRTEQIVKYQGVLLRLSKQDFSCLKSTLKGITETDSKTLEVERVSVWFFSKDYSKIVCEDIYIKGKGLHEADITLHAKDHPVYFSALNECRMLAVNDACNDPQTCEFTEGYLKPHGISSMLDVPVRLHGKLIGIVCHEHTGPVREWTREEQDFAASIADMVSLAIETNKRQKMEKMLIQSEKLKAMGVITSGIAHEFNNILAIISGNVQLLERGHKDNKKLTDSLHIIKMATDDGAEISNRMLKFTNTNNDTKGLVSCDTGDLINHAIDFTMPRWKNMAQANDINYRIEKNLMINILPVLCNPTELREVFINIINNALDAMPDGGTITVATRCIRSEKLQERREEENASSLQTPNTELKRKFVEITFTDTGEGMSEEVKKRVFDPFFTTKSPLGTGLGMSTVYGIITRYGGKIEVESESGKGSVFTLQIPAATKTDNTKENPASTLNTQSESLYILVVDDEENMCTLLNEFLTDNHKVKTVNNGADAIKLSNKEKFDLVLCDIAMPEVSGYDVIKALNKLDEIPKIGIITGWDGKLNVLDENNMEVDFIIKKPFRFAELTRQIDELFI